MTDAIDSFVASLDRKQPPPLATPMLRAVWHGLRGDWEAAHELAQAQDDAEGAWVTPGCTASKAISATPTTGIDARAGRRTATLRVTRDSRSLRALIRSANDV
jgi:hypothetical protein